MSHEPLNKEDRKIIRIIIAGVCLPLLDTTIVNVAINDLSAVFSAPLSIVQWVTTVYTLAAATVIPICGWSVNRYGCKNMWIFSLTVFLLGSLLSAAAWSVNSLIAFRVIQGIGSGMLMPIMQTLLVKSVGQEKTRVAMTSIAVPAVVAPILGPIIGGLLLHWAGWRWLFLINIPLCLFALIFAYKKLAVDQERNFSRFDVCGFILLSPGLGAIIFGVTGLIHDKSIANAYSTFSLSLGLLLIAFFVTYAARSKSHVQVLVDIKLFKIPSVSISSVLLLTSSTAFYGGLFLLPLYFYRVCGYDPMSIGILLGVQGVGALIARNYLHCLTNRWGERDTALISIALATIGTFYFVWPIGMSNLTLTICALTIRGAGLGLLTIHAMSAIYQGLEKSQIAHASVLSRIFTQVGASFGGAGVVVILQNLLLKTPVTIINSSYYQTFWWLSALTIISIVPAYLLDSTFSKQALSEAKEIGK